jgi:hypothetical protein
MVSHIREVILGGNSEEVCFCLCRHIELQHLFDVVSSVGYSSTSSDEGGETAKHLEQISPKVFKYLDELVHRRQQKNNLGNSTAQNELGLR